MIFRPRAPERAEREEDREGQHVEEGDDQERSLHLPVGEIDALQMAVAVGCSGDGWILK